MAFDVVSLCTTSQKSEKYTYKYIDRNNLCISDQTTLKTYNKTF